jgi:membrane associated rhomboid family serine protease
MDDNEKIPVVPPDSEGNGGREPILNLPTVVAVLAAVIVAVWAIAAFALNESQQFEVNLWGGFLPYRLVDPAGVPGGLWPLLWTPLTHAFLHAGFEHVAFNTLWMVIFATPVARRYGSVPTLVIFAASAIAGAIAFAATTLPGVQFLVGASGGVAGLTGAATRFIFQPVLYAPDAETGAPVALGRRLAGLGEVFVDPRSRTFVILWVVLNAAVPLLPVLVGGTVDIAWQAHLGGFFTGLLLVGLFERRN